MTKQQLLAKFEQLLALARKQGYSPQIEISQPAAKRQAITVKDIYLRALDGGDAFHCCCCSYPYEQRDDYFRGTVPTPINWCNQCRELLREMTIGAALRKHEEARVGKAVIIQQSVDRINKLLARK